METTTSFQSELQIRIFVQYQMNLKASVNLSVPINHYAVFKTEGNIFVNEKLPVELIKKNQRLVIQRQYANHHFARQ